MGISIVYFAAADDEEAAAALRRTGGPLGWPLVVGERKVGWFKKEPIIEELGPGYEGFKDGYDHITVEVMGAILRDVPFSKIESKPQYSETLPAGNSDESPIVCTITNDLRDALASATEEQLEAVVGPWMQTDELQARSGWEDTPSDHLRFLRRLRNLAARAVDQGGRLYCYYEL
jgi:hypothetical protein